MLSLPAAAAAAAAAAAVAMATVAAFDFLFNWPVFEEMSPVPSKMNFGELFYRPDALPETKPTV